MSTLMPTLETVPRVLLDPDLECDGLSLPGEIRLNPRMLAASKDFLALTLAHEVAHQWWGAYGQKTALPNEGMSELMAYHWLAKAHGADAERDAAQIARGKMFHGFLGHGTTLSEADVMGRQVLVLRDAHRLFGQEFWRAARQIHAGDTPTQMWVSALLHTLRAAYTLPLPVLVDGKVIDADATGLFAAVDLQCSDRCHQTVPFGARCGPTWAMGTRQSGAVFDDHHHKDIACYLAAVTA